jgi:hypothetical protein
VIVTDVAFVVCQVNVTLCPEVIELELAVSVTVGLGGAGGGEDLVAQPLNPAKTVDETTRAMQRCSVFLIPNVCIPRPYSRAKLQMRGWQTMLLSNRGVCRNLLDRLRSGD